MNPTMMMGAMNGLGMQPPVFNAGLPTDPGMLMGMGGRNPYMMPNMYDPNPLMQD